VCFLCAKDFVTASAFQYPTGFERMMSGKARFRVVLETGA
jgi:hypothetical protein